jgi:PilZ domain
MRERRKLARNRSFLGGVIAFNNRNSTMTCLVRNLSVEGAKICFTNTVTVPDEFDLTIKQKERTLLARMVWRRADEAGIVFLNDVFLNEKLARAPIPLDWARRLHDCEAEKAALRRRVTQLSTAE